MSLPQGRIEDVGLRVDRLPETERFPQVSGSRSPIAVSYQPLLEGLLSEEGFWLERAVALLDEHLDFAFGGFELGLAGG